MHVTVFVAVIGGDFAGDSFAFDEGAVADQAGHIEGVARGDLRTCAVLPDEAQVDRMSVRVGFVGGADQGVVDGGDRVGAQVEV